MDDVLTFITTNKCTFLHHDNVTNEYTLSTKRILVKNKHRLILNKITHDDDIFVLINGKIISCNVSGLFINLLTLNTTLEIVCKNQFSFVIKKID